MSWRAGQQARYQAAVDSCKVGKELCYVCLSGSFITTSISFRKITDKIEECEQELDKLETEREIKEEEQHQLQIAFNQTADIHEQNVERLENLLSGGVL